MFYFTFTRSCKKYESKKSFFEYNKSYFELFRQRYYPRTGYRPAAKARQTTEYQAGSAQYPSYRTAGHAACKNENPPLGQAGNRTRSFYPAALVDQTGDRNTVHPGIGRTEYNGNMQDARRCSFEFRFSDCKSGKNSDVVSRPAKNSYGFFSRSRSECPDFFLPLSQTNLSTHFTSIPWNSKEPFTK